MNKDEIIEMARESGLETQDGFSESVFYFAKLVALRYEKKISDLENIICQRHWDVLQEREACAKVCDEYAITHGMKGDDNNKAQGWMMMQCGAAIRARGQA